MGSTTTARDVCRQCGSAWRAGAPSCPRCGATIRSRIAVPPPPPQESVLELDREPRKFDRPRPDPRAGLRNGEALAESPTSELAPEPAPQGDPATLVALSQLLSGALGLLLLAQLFFPQVLPSLTPLLLRALHGERVEGLQWLLGAAPWVLTGWVLGLALAAARRASERPVVRSVLASVVPAVLPGVLLWGWEALHAHLASALVRRGGRPRAELMVGWSRAVLVCLSAEVLLVVLDGFGLVALPRLALGAAAALAIAARQGHLCALAISLPGLLLRLSRTGAPLPSQLVCPQCGADAPTLRRFREGLAGNACARCAGALLGPGQVSTLLSMAEVEDAVYRREIRLGASGNKPLHCPQCGTSMRGVQLRNVTAHGCPACGSLWLDRIGLARLSGGRQVMAVTPAKPAPAPSGVWPLLTALVVFGLTALPWVGVRAGWCRPEAGACASVPAAVTAD